MYSIQHYVIKVCQGLETGQCFSPGTPDSIIKADRHDITEILLKVALNTISLTQTVNVLTGTLEVYARYIKQREITTRGDIFIFVFLSINYYGYIMTMCLIFFYLMKGLIKLYSNFIFFFFYKT